MPCSLTKQGTVLWTGAIGAPVTIKIVADNTRLVSARYNNAALPVQNDKSTAFQLVAGRKPLVLVLAPVTEDLEVVEVCPAGGTQHIFGYKNDSEEEINIRVLGR